MLLQNFAMMKVPGYVKLMLDEIGKANRFEALRGYGLWILAYTAVIAVSLYLMRNLIIGVSRKIEYELRRDLYHKLLSLEYLYYRRRQTGDIMSRCTNDLNHVRTLLGPGVMYIPNSVSRLLMFLPVLLHLSGFLVSVLTILMLVLVLLITRLLPLLRPLFQKTQEAMGAMNNRVWQVISGISTIKRFTVEPFEIQRFQSFNRDYIRIQMSVVKLQELLRPLFFYIFSLSELVILWFGGRLVIQGQMTMGELLQFNIMIGALTFPILALGWMIALFQQGISALGRINVILEHKSEDRENEELKQLTAPEMALEVRHLTYAYEPHLEPVLRDISFTVEPGRTVGITGPVGSGKTTLINIISGLIPPGPGMVYVNGTDIMELDLRSMYRKTAVVPQDPFLFSRTVGQNIALGREDMAPDDIDKSAADAGLTKDLEAFHDGMDQLVGERGITLSGGQKQRVAIARALSKCAPLLVLDDPLSNVDARTEAQILMNLQQLHCFSTLIVVSHRISVLKNADVILVLKEGKVVEQGSHMELSRIEGGLYARLASLQQMEMELDSE